MSPTCIYSFHLLQQCNHPIACWILLGTRAGVTKLLYSRLCPQPDCGSQSDTQAGLTCMEDTPRSMSMPLAQAPSLQAGTWRRSSRS